MSILGYAQERLPTGGDRGHRSDGRSSADIVVVVISECAALKFLDKPVQCKGDKASDLLSLIAAQSFALLAVEKTRN